MTIAIVTFASAAIIYMILCPLIDWYKKVTKEMEEAERHDRAE